MVVFKITLGVSGTNFKPNDLVTAIKDEFTVANSYNQGDKIRGGRSNKICEVGMISIWNPKKFGFQGEGVEYEEWFVKFIERNYSKFVEYGMEELDLYIEVYTQGDEQCNFEIFDKNMLKRLTKYDISLPISIYVLTEAEIQQLLT